MASEGQVRICVDQMKGGRLMNYKEIAFNKQTVQSSTYSAEYRSSNGVTGDPTTFFHTKKEMSPYWYVDLGQVYHQIDRIELVNRESWGERLQNLHVSVSKDLSEGFKDIYIFKGPGKNGESFIIKCKDVTNVRYVKLTLKDIVECLHMAMVRVYAYDNGE